MMVAVVGVLLVALITLLVPYHGVNAAPPIVCPPDLPEPITPPPGCEPASTPSTDSPVMCLSLAASVAGGESNNINQIVVYSLTLSNVGAGRARSVMATIPFNVARQEVLDVQFSSNDAWVSDVSPKQVELQFGAISPKSIITATLYVNTRIDGIDSENLTTRASVRWRERRSEMPSLSNQVKIGITLDRVEVLRDQLMIEVNESSSIASIVYNGFTSEERVAFWYETSEKRNILIGDTVTDAQGIGGRAVDLSSLAPDSYQFVAYGTCSYIIATGILDLSD